MISSRLVRAIESHWETLSTRVIAKIRRDPELVHLRKLSDTELLDRGLEVLQNLGHWLVATKEEEVARCFEGLGRLRRQEMVPLHESVRSVHILKDAMLDYIRAEGMGPTAVELYAEEELEHRVGEFFDCVVYHLVRGYEGALGKAAHAGGGAV